MGGPRIAFSHRFKACPGVVFILPRPNFSDFSPEEKDLIRTAEKIYYPTPLFVDILLTMGKKIFPSRETYVYSGDKIKQTVLFELLRIPHPPTRFFFGRQKDRIPTECSFPFIAKIPRGSSMGEGVYLIRDEAGLKQYLRRNPVAYIQEYLILERDLRVILINHQVILAYWKKGAAGEFRHNVAQGGDLDFGRIPPEALEFARRVTQACNFDDVGLDLCHTEKKGWMVLEANMNYGRQGLVRQGLNLPEVYRSLMEKGII
jgi:ribosomal protein S6--L-glutamate ligase